LGIATLVVLAAGRAACAPEEAGSVDERFLREAHVPTDDAGLLAYLRGRSLDRADPERLEQLVRQLGSDRVTDRERASQQLVNLGRTAEAALRRATGSADPEVVLRARWCLEQIRKQAGLALPLAAVRVLVQRRPSEALATLLRYLPFAGDEETQEEIVYGLDALALRGGKLDPALLTALADGAPARRAAAACIVGRQGGSAGRASVRKLLTDPSPLVRLRAAQGLLAGQDPAGLPVLIALLEDPSADIAWQAEEMLHWAAGDKAPAVTVGAPTPESGKRCRAAWEAWYRAKGASVDLAKRLADYRRPGLLLVCGTMPGQNEPGKTAVWLCGCDGKPRWLLPDMQACDVQLLPGNRVLVGDAKLEQVTERDLHGKILWRAAASKAFVCRRLANGNTFLGDVEGVAREIDPGGQELYADKPGEQKQAADVILNVDVEPRRLGNGHVAYLSTLDNKSAERDPVTRHEFSRVTLKRGVGIELLPNGHWFLVWANQFLEVDGSGAEIWQCRVSRVLRLEASATRLRNGNTVLAGGGGSASQAPVLVEVEPDGRKVWELWAAGSVRRVRPCLGLVRLGFDGPRPPAVDLDAAANRIGRLKDRDPAVRALAARLLEHVGAKAAPAIPVLIETLSDSDDEVQYAALEALESIGRAVVPAVLRAMTNERTRLRGGATSLAARMAGEDERLLPGLLKAMRDPSPYVRRCATFGLGKMRRHPDEVVPVLIAALSDQAEAKEEPTAPALDRRSTDGPLCRSAALALGNMGPSARAAIPALLKSLNDPDQGLSAVSCYALVKIDPQDKRIVPSLVEVLKGQSPGSRADAASALGRIGPQAKAAVSALLEALKAKDERDPERAQSLREAAAYALGRIDWQTEETVPALAEALKAPDRDGSLRRTIVRALTQLGPKAKRAIPALIDLIESGWSGAEGDEVVNALAAIGSEEAVPRLVKILHDAKATETTLTVAVQALGKLGPKAKAAVPAIRGTLEENHDTLFLDQAKLALKQIEGKD
jgi:HEAT repeat protein